MKKIDQKLINQFLQRASEELLGEWILIGGSLLPLLGVAYRSTEDIDFVGFGTSERAQNLELLEIAEKIGLPVASINQAGSLFLKRIPLWKKHILSLKKGKNAEIFRPTTNLFILLKLNRLSDTDLQDCLEFLKYSKKKKESVDTKLILKAIEAKKKTAISAPMLERLKELEIAIRRTN